MKVVSGILAALVLSACATPVDPAVAYQQFHDSMYSRTDPDGQRVVSSAPSNEAKYPIAYNNGSNGIAMWVMAYKPVASPARVVFAGSRVRGVLPSEVSKNEPTGPWDRPDPAYIGSPWREADFAYIERETKCVDDGQWCNRTQRFEIRLTPEQVRAFIRADAPDTIPIGLFDRLDVDWRIQKVELLAALDVLGVTDEFR